MFKRVTWVGVGFTLVVGTTVVAARKARRQLDRYTPHAMVDRVNDCALAVRERILDALDDGRSAARERERELLEQAVRDRGADRIRR